MFLAPPITNTRYTATYLFHSLKSQAKKDSLFAKFLGKNSRLPIFPKGEYLSYTNRKYLGSQDIPIDSIAGTMTENNDYDDKFRPIKDHLSRRWVQVYDSPDPGRSTSIVAFKFGERYFIEAGHLIVSVESSKGVLFVQAEVWEYSTGLVEPENFKMIIPPARITECACVL